MSNINKVLINGTEYEIEALHFFSSSNLDTPTQWKDYIDSQISTAAKIQLVTDSWNTAKTAPATAAGVATMGKIYLCANEGTLSGNYTEFVTIQSGEEGSYTYTWEKIGTTETDLSKYAKAGTYTSTGSGQQTSNVSYTGISISSSGGHTTSAATFTGTYSKVSEATGQNTSVSTSGVTGDAGAFSVTPKFTGTAATITGNVSGASLNTIAYTPAGGISGSQTVSAHSHTVNVSKATQSVLTKVSADSNGSHAHTVESHTHNGSGQASVINSFSGGSITSAGTITAVKSVSSSLTTKNYGFSSAQTVLSSATVSGTVLSFGTATAGTQDALSISTTTATVNTGYTHTAASLSYKASDSFAKAAEAATLTTSSAGDHSHNLTVTAATISYVTGATTSAAGGVTINGTSFSFNGTEATLQPTFATEGSVSISYTPSGSVSAVSIGNHGHSYDKPVAHTHSITSTSADIAVSGTVDVSNHTHTIVDNGHTHTINSHTHNVTISN